MIACRVHTPARIETNPLHFELVPIPTPGPGQVRIKISMCGVCHTDLHIAEGEIHPPRLPITPGHQVVGTVDAIGPQLTSTQGSTERGNLATGQRVGMPWRYSSCGTCEYCLRGLENLCPKAEFTGFSVDGGFAEYMLARASDVLPLPETLSDEQAAPLLCAGIVGYRSLRLAEILPNEHVGLFGFGASGHLCLQVLEYWGCRVSVFTRTSIHQQHARQLGAIWTGSPSEAPSEALDRAIIFAPSGALVVRALELVRPGGTVAINAIHMSNIPEFPYNKIYAERTVRSVANATYRDGTEFLSLAVTAGIKSTVNIFKLSEANRALQAMKASQINGEAVLKIS